MFALLGPVVVNSAQFRIGDINRLSADPAEKKMVIVRLDQRSLEVNDMGVDDNKDALGQRKRAHREVKISELKSRLKLSSAQGNPGKFNDPSLLSMALNRSQLAELVKDPGVQIFENRIHRPMLADSVARIFPNQATSPYDGSGWAVAVLDTGVNKNHTFFSGKVIAAAEACFSNDNNSGNLPGGSSLCPGGAGSATGSGAGANCDASLNGCNHGTKIAGIVAGSNGPGGMNGVAPGANIIPVQIYSKSIDEIVCGGEANTPCIGALSTDIIRALEYIYSIRSTHQIAAINMSLGTVDTFEGFCDTLPEKSAIDDLRSAGIATVAASGNAGIVNEMTSPACISSAISVAATIVPATIGAPDQAWAGNNRSTALDLFAPGVAINTSNLPISTFGFDTGTSIAAAHVAGAWAVLKDAGASGVTQIENLFKSTGPNITQDFVTARRISVTSAISKLKTKPPVNDSDDFCLPISASNGKIVLICL